jgi:hypothetical protein
MKATIFILIGLPIVVILYFTVAVIIREYFKKD